jgi:hypothetical protein
MANFFDKVKDDVVGLEESLLGPDYKYFEYINTPSQLGMSSNGSISTLTKDVAGLIGYVELLSEGGGRASQVSGPLGNKFFLETGAKCNDIATSNLVTRSLYVNNVPDGSIPFISSALGGTNFTTFKGLIPGTLSNLSQINPMQMFGAFMAGTHPDCQAITMETIDVNNVKSQQTAFVTKTDINGMSPCWFTNNTNPVTNAACKEAFTTISDSQEYSNYVKQYNTTHDVTGRKEQKIQTVPNDVVVKLYYSSLSLLVLYIFLKMFQNKK